VVKIIYAEQPAKLKAGRKPRQQPPLRRLPFIERDRAARIIRKG
jgi:hypothetical protein